MSRLTESIIIERVDSYNTYLKGRSYYEAGKVTDIRRTSSQDYYIASVMGSSIYRSSVKFNTYDDIETTNCTCQAFKKYSGDCKHIVGLLMFIMNYEKIGSMYYK